MSDAERVRQIYDRVRPFTMIGLETASSMYQAARLCLSENIAGALVECGLWKGGSLMAGMLAFLDLDGGQREVWGYDNFSGMPQPDPCDGEQANALFGTEKDWCLANQAEVEQALASTGYPPERVHVIAGPVETTLPAQAPAQIAVLRLDTDWYGSTLHELKHLYPRLSPGGVLIIDDYGAWPGCRRAVAEYFQGIIPAMIDINWTARLIRKPTL